MHENNNNQISLPGTTFCINSITKLYEKTEPFKSIHNVNNGDLQSVLINTGTELGLIPVYCENHNYLLLFDYDDPEYETNNVTKQINILINSDTQTDATYSIKKSFSVSLSRQKKDQLIFIDPHHLKNSMDELDSTINTSGFKTNPMSDTLEIGFISRKNIIIGQYFKFI